MERSLQETQQWISENKSDLSILSGSCHLIICPDFCSLSSATQLLQETQIAVGGQNCASHERGAYTGQISVQSLHDTGSTYCIIGHSEVRSLGATDQDIAQKAQLLLTYSLIPIICIAGKEQLLPLLPIFNNNRQPLLAYEPLWAIGTGKTPSSQELNNTLEQLEACFIEQGIAIPPILYGGSVTAQSAQEYQSATNIKGFLIGRGSLDFQNLKKIVLSVI